MALVQSTCGLPNGNAYSIRSTPRRAGVASRSIASTRRTASSVRPPRAAAPALAQPASGMTRRPSPS